MFFGVSPHPVLARDHGAAGLSALGWLPERTTLSGPGQYLG